MSATTYEISQCFLALLLFLVVAHLCGALFQKLKQPVVIGEILGGILLGPTVLGQFFPDLLHNIFLNSALVKHVLSFSYSLGLILLLFTSGLEIERLFVQGQRRTSWALALGGTFLPLICGLLLMSFVQFDYFIAERGSHFSLSFVLGCAAAVTSLPVLSRIFMELGILQTPFSRLVLTSAFIDDIILYLIMALIITFAQSKGESSFGVVGWIFTDASRLQQSVISIFLQAAFAYLILMYGQKWLGRLSAGRWHFLIKRQITATYLIFLLLTVLVGFLVSMPFMLSAFCAGVACAKLKGEDVQNQESLKVFSLAFFVPLYFAIVGYRIHLSDGFPWLFTFFFIIFATLIKSSSIWVVAKLARYSNQTALDLAITMNARGGPGIILASVAYDEKIITLPLFSSLVVLAILTSLFSGQWLRYRHRQSLLDLQLSQRKSLHEKS